MLMGALIGAVVGIIVVLVKNANAKKKQKSDVLDSDISED